MAKKNDGVPWLLVGALAAGLWWAFGGSASAQTSTAPATLGTAAKSYMSQLTAAQTAYLNGSQSLQQYQAAATGILVGAASDPAVSTSDLASLKAVGGATA